MIGAIHDLVIYPLTSSTGPSPTIDAEGRVSREPSELEGVTVRGSVDEVQAQEQLLAAQKGQSHDIAVRLDPAQVIEALGQDISDRDEVEVSTPTRLAGRYRIDVIRTLRNHLRLLCSRTTIRDES